MGGVGVGVVGAEVRRHDVDPSPGARDAVDFAHRAHHIFKVLDDVGEIYFRSRVVPHRPGKLIEIAEGVGGGIETQIESDRIRFLVPFSAADVDDHDGFAASAGSGG